MIQNIKLNHLDPIIEGEISYWKVLSQIIMKDVKWYQIWRLRMIKNMVDEFIDGLKDLNISSANFSSKCQVVMEDDIDYISFMAMLELQARMRTPEESTMMFIANVVATATFAKRFDKTDFDSEGILYKAYVEEILQYPLVEMAGVLNKIKEQVEASSELWDRRFASVEVFDEDYDNAGGRGLKIFSVQATIRMLCQAYMVDWDKAWQMSYTVSQTTSYENAMKSYVQDQIAKNTAERNKSKNM